MMKRSKKRQEIDWIWQQIDNYQHEYTLKDLNEQFIEMLTKEQREKVIEYIKERQKVCLW